MRFFIIHGAYGNPKENWLPWLKQELEKQGHEVIIPQFPTPEDQSLDNWRKVFSEYNHLVDKETAFIGHSLGPSFILDILESHPAKGAIFVAGFAELLGNEFDEVNHTFVKRSFDWDKIRGNCESFIVINSDNDPYVALEKGKNLAQKLSTSMIVLSNAGHINAEAGYKEFPFLLSLILKHYG